MNTSYNYSIIFGVAICWTTDQCYWLFFTFLPHKIYYWRTRTRLFHSYWQISWWWWLLIFASRWNYPKRRPGNINGAYWTNFRADQHDILSKFKDLKRKHQALYSRSIFAEVYKVFWLHLKIMTLNIIGLAYFTSRIFLYKVGYLVIPSRHKLLWSKRCKQGRQIFHVHTSVLNIYKRFQDHSITFETDSSTIICDNSANVHICSSKSIFIGPMRCTYQHYVATIGGNKNSISGMGTVQWRWKDDLGKIHTLDIENFLYFPQSPVNILGITILADKLKDNDDTVIDTKRNKSWFYWDKNKFQRKINHPPSNIPELPINEGFLMASMFSKLVGNKV